MGKIDAASADPSAAGDLSLIFNYMKILDPNSVVRESEFATAANSAGVPDRVRNVWNKALSGERLAEDQREDFVGTAQVLFASQERNQRLLEGNFTGIAERNGINPDDVIVDFIGEPIEPQSETVTGPTPTPAFSSAVSDAARQSGLTVQEMWDAATPEERRNLGSQ